ncbi:MAG TPA: FAD-binding oxidoreductase, partial [Planctomycetota bacterium]|nr:FAD-binding oxidoreductase [Planctomycetota bacterium]
MRIAGLLSIAGIVLLIGRPAFLLTAAWLDDRHDRTQTRAGWVDDASRMEAARAAEIVVLPAARDEAEAKLREVLARARADHLQVSIAGARHTMGGQTIAPDGLAIEMLPFRSLELDEAARLLTAGAGARWSEILPYLDARGLSVSVMQSNDDFTVGGSLSANCHGWQCLRPPIASTVESLRLMLADGSIVRCSRTENAELFSLVLGGYGLFGIILDATLRVVPDERYARDARILPAARYSESFRERVGDDARMAYGRLCVAPGEAFLKEAILTVFESSPGEIVPLGEEVTGTTLRRIVYRAQRGSAAGKELRWFAERTFRTGLDTGCFSRNGLLQDPAAVYAEENDDRSDILHEYFVPIARAEKFLEQVRVVVPRFAVDLMNVTVRDVKEDVDSFL